MKPIVLAITGGSGAIYAVRLLEVLLSARREVHLVISPTAAEVFREELGTELDLDTFSLDQFPLDAAGMSESHLDDDSNALSSIIHNAPGGSLHYHHHRDFSAGIASGSFLTDGMIICPCSTGSLSAIANGLSSNLIHRAAQVHIKERRKLVVVPRETPLSSIQLGNMKTLSDNGAVILPASPGFYHNPVSIHDLVDFVVARICDQVGIDKQLMRRWGTPEA